MNPNWAVIINPMAGKGNGLKDWSLIQKLLNGHGISFTHCLTEKKGHATELASHFISIGFRQIMVIGGDGTLSEAACGILTQHLVPSVEITLAQIATGTGNDWQKTFGLEPAYESSVNRISAGLTFLQDAGIAFYRNPEGKDEKKHFINIAGMGFDAMVVFNAELQRQKGKSGRLIYLLTLLRSLFKSKDTEINLQAGNEMLHCPVFTLAVGIGRYNGGGMMMLPSAISDDGLFDITIVRHLSKPDVIINIPNLYNGRFIKHPAVIQLKNAVVTIDSTQHFGLELDGEYAGTAPARFEIIPRCLKMIV